MRVRRTAAGACGTVTAKSACFEQRDVRQVVADVRAFVGCETELAAQALHGVSLSCASEHDVRNAQLLRACVTAGAALPVIQTRRRCLHARAGSSQTPSSAERLELVAVIVDVNAPSVSTPSTSHVRSARASRGQSALLGHI